MAQQRPTVLVTGAARRLGAAIARRFGEAGWHVVVHCRGSTEEAEALAASLPSAEVEVADLGDCEEVEALVSRVAQNHRDWRTLVCSAAVFEEDAADALDPTTFDRAMAINTRAPVMLTQRYLREASAATGRRAILLTDQKLANPNPDFFSYTLSKHAVSGAATLLAMAHAGAGDRVYALAPGAILASHDQSEDEIEVSHRLNLLRRKTGAEEVAQAALFLASGALASGSSLFVDSGQHLLAQPRDVIYLARAGAIEQRSD